MIVGWVKLALFLLLWQLCNHMVDRIGNGYSISLAQVMSEPAMCLLEALQRLVVSFVDDGFAAYMWHHAL